MADALACECKADADDIHGSCFQSITINPSTEAEKINDAANAQVLCLITIVSKEAKRPVKYEMVAEASCRLQVAGKVGDRHWRPQEQGVGGEVEAQCGAIGCFGCDCDL